jgi:hypothetical protein
MVSLPAHCRMVVCLAVLLPPLGGCFVPTLYPENYQTLPTPLAPVQAQIHAFRVDIESHSTWEKHQGQTTSDLWPRQEIQQLSSIALDTTSKPNVTQVPAQRCNTWRYGWGLWVPFWYTSDDVVCHGVGIRLYAPGYNLIVLKQGQDVRELLWIPANDLRAQVAALDALYFPDDQPKVGPFDKGLKVALVPGSTSKQHHDALQFGISEYDRLSAVARLQGGVPAELLAKLESRASKLRELVDR